MLGARARMPTYLYTGLQFSTRMYTHVCVCVRGCVCVCIPYIYIYIYVQLRMRMTIYVYIFRRMATCAYTQGCTCLRTSSRARCACVRVLGSGLCLVVRALGPAVQSFCRIASVSPARPFGLVPGVKVLPVVHRIRPAT